MKQFKRALALALTIVMVMSVAAISASANDGDDSASTAASDQLTSLPVTKIVKTTTTNVALPSETFYFRMTPAATGSTIKVDDGTNITVHAGVAFTNSADGVTSVSFDASDDTSTGSVQKSTSFDLTKISFPQSGIYRYYVTEVVKKTTGGTDTYEAPTKPADGVLNYITYDYTKYQVDLYVKQSTSGTGYYVYNVSVAYADDDEKTKPNGILFTNEIACANIEIIKTVVDPHNTEDYTTKLFDFYILIPVGGDTITLTKGETLDARIYKGTTLVNDDRSDANGIVKLTVNGDSIDADVETYGTHFQLKDGEHLEISAPVSMIYRVEEKVRDYSISVEYTEYGQFTGSKTYNIAAGSNVVREAKLDSGGDSYNLAYVKGTTNTETNRIIYTNSKDAASDTGVHLDFAPYVVILLAAIVGGALFLFFKKRRTAR